jgi:hypothetical protein
LDLQLREDARDVMAEGLGAALKQLGDLSVGVMVEDRLPGNEDRSVTGPS